MTPPVSGDGQWCAYQLHRPDLDEGMLLAFRRQASPYTGLSVTLKALDPEKTYSIAYPNGGPDAAAIQQSGQELMAAFELRIPQSGGSQLMVYKAIAP